MANDEDFHEWCNQGCGKLYIEASGVQKLLKKVGGFFASLLGRTEVDSTATIALKDRRVDEDEHLEETEL